MKDIKKMLIAEMIPMEGVTKEELADLIVAPQDMSLGDYALPCFRFAKLLRKSPKEIAENLRDRIEIVPPFSAVEAVNGYLNFRLDKISNIKKILTEVAEKGKDYGASEEGQGKTICIDYSSINIAKPFHIGHLSTTVIGSALCKIYKKLGYKTVGINHLGDWGTQFGKLIVAYKKWGNARSLKARGVKYLTELYVRYHKEAETDSFLDIEARTWFKKIEDGNPEAIALWTQFKEITLSEVKKIYKRLHVTFDSYNGEAFYNDKMQPVLDELEATGLLIDSDGAKIVDLKEYDMPPCLVLRSDGATLYATRDIAAAMYRKKRYNFDKSLYVVAYQQNLHFKQFFKVIELMGREWYKDLIHVQFGMVSLENGEAMSTRHGKVVLLEDVLDTAVKKSLKIINEKSPKLKDKERIAEKVGVGAVIFSALYMNRIKDITFSYDKVLNFDGETGPYTQYTNARCNSVLKKDHATLKRILSGEYVFADEDFSGVDNPEGQALVTLIGRYGETISEAAEKYEPSILTRYIVNLCQAYNKFYYEHRIITAPEGQREARLLATFATQKVIEDGLKLLGIQCPSEM